MYCVKCGVELADSEAKCPLCGTPVYLPGYVPSEDKPYPKFEKPEKFSPRGIYFILSFICFIGAVISLVCDLNLGGGISWSGYVLTSIALFYILFILPGWFRRFNPAIFIPCDFVAIGLFLAYINLATGGKWFLTFAFPITGAVTLIISSITILSFYLKRGYLYIFGGAFIAAGLFCPVMELLGVLTFGGEYIRWGFYPLIALCLIGIMLIVIAIVKPFRESLFKIFSI
jgi:hypothetical protein